jgi:hypothetical protein
VNGSLEEPEVSGTEGRAFSRRTEPESKKGALASEVNQFDVAGHVLKKARTTRHLYSIRL